MEEFALEKVKWSGDDWSIELSKTPPQPRMIATAGMAVAPAATEGTAPAPKRERAPKTRAAEPKGTPITSPMTGIFYASPSPGADPYVKVGESVSAGQIIGLIEAMKVFNEITATVSGIVTDAPVSNGSLVNPGDVLVRIG